MQTERLEQTDAYVRTFDATVLHVDGDVVTLDRSAFYPGGGGQPPDFGVLSWDGGSARVVGQKVEGAPPPVGDAVRGEVEWDRRHALMRTHTALHVLCAVVWRDWGAKVTGGNMEPLSGRMDFEFESLTGDLVRVIEARVNAEIAADRPVQVSFMPRARADEHPDLIRTKVNLLPPTLQVVRVVEIVGLDVQADGGTHVASTAEIGHVHVVDYQSKGRINKRLRIAVT